MDTNRPGFQPLGCGSPYTQGFALGWYGSAPLALGHPQGVWVLSRYRRRTGVCGLGMNALGVDGEPEFAG